MSSLRGWLLLVAGAAGAASADDTLRQDALERFGRLDAPAPAALATPEVELGRALFWDPRVSLDGKTACASCHPVADWGADKRKASIDAKGLPTSRHSPTIFNSVGQPTLRWLGDRKNAADQAEGSMTGSMGFASKADGIAKLEELRYAAAFKVAYPGDAEAMTPANYGRAISAYEATLVTPAPFDRFLAGDDKALTEKQKAGLRTFIATGCAACHNGALLGGTTMRKFGVTRDYWLETGSAKPDVGRFATTKKEEDRYVFRVPMLRNVAKTQPYFHDGSVETLDRAVRVMAAVQLGRKLDDATAASIVDFLEALTGDAPANYAPPASLPK
jgi:cytochrome c peroxidase